MTYETSKNTYDGNRSERNLLKFLNFVENHRNLLSLEAYQDRMNVSNGDWRLERHPRITYESIQAHRTKIEEKAELLENLMIQRDKYFAHMDKAYFDKTRELIDDAPLSFGDFADLIDLAKDILNDYSAAFDGTIHTVTPDNIYDFDCILRKL